MIRLVWLQCCWLLLVVSLTTTNAVELNPANFEVETAGKVVFINFYSPTCGHCTAMKPAWEQLEAEYAGHERYIVGTVNCQEHRMWCGKTFQTQGYPTMLYGNPAQQGIFLDEYEEERDYESLSAFAKEMFPTPTCDFENLGNCSSDVMENLAEMNLLPASKKPRLADLAAESRGSGRGEDDDDEEEDDEPDEGAATEGAAGRGATQGDEL